MVVQQETPTDPPQGAWPAERRRLFWGIFVFFFAFFTLPRLVLSGDSAPLIDSTVLEILERVGGVLITSALPSLILAWLISLTRRGEVADVQRTHKHADAPSGIGGWLVLPAIALVIWPVTGVLLLVQFVGWIWNAAFADDPRMEPGAQVFMVALGAIHLALLIITIHVALLFFRKRRIAPIALCFLLVLSACTGAVVLVWLGIAFGSIPFDGIVYTCLTGVLAGLWFAYSRFSKRVKATFTR